MGGTRCVFRDCQVSTHRNPKMHFFKFPIRDPARLQIWLQNCGNADILNVAREKLNNRSVCARHFRYECFMNYKLDRLIPNQTPTLVRLSKDLAWDLEHLDENGEATMVKLAPPTKAHLIPPDNFVCPLGFSEDTRSGRTYAAKRRIPPKPLRVEPNKRHKTEAEALKPEQQLNVKQLHLDTSADSKLGEETAVILGPACEPKTEEFQLKYEQLKANYEEILKKNTDLEESIDKLRAESEAQAEAHAKAIAELKDQTKVPKTNGSSSSLTPLMTKPQLYSSIKKYLGPTMAALVRMEMFGGAERAWKADERNFAKELLQLGENFYIHCCDEWRFRLPSMRMAQSWLNEMDNKESEEELL